MEKVMNVMGIGEICIGYGQTEASPIITFTEADDPIALRVGTVGRPLPGVEVKLVDPATGTETPADAAGELCARGHCVMAGYYRDPEATRRAVDPEGWLYTGDLSRRGESGTYRIVGRRKELIIRGGENIYPPEVEEFLHHHDDIAEVAVVGLPDPKYGEIVAAWIVPRSGVELSPQEIKAYCHGQISHYKIPQHIFIVATLPKTVTGKVRKHVLKENAVSELGLLEAAAIPTA